MRVLAVYLTLLVLLVASVGAGFIASDWPRWCTRAHWCSGQWPRHPGAEPLSAPTPPGRSTGAGGPGTH
ncbi:MAG: hypothetical protein ACREU2_09610 [Steroidobacteraceae bacterium]